ncbi:MAG: hypothetical protein K2Y01_01490 [Rhabdochlamydiaceae bacterium]|nr:hypothetical protein [Rhabdochlamydiaceae bacterium]
MKSYLKYLSPLFYEKSLLSSSAFAMISSLLLLPFLFVLLHFFFYQRTVSPLKAHIEFLQEKVQRKEALKKKEEKVLSQILRSHSNYLEKVLGSLVLLASERQKWQLFSEQMETSHPMKERVTFLQSGGNSLQFVQIEKHKNALFQETEEKQQNPVEMCEEDLKSLLCYLEGSQIHPYVPQEGAPQILIKSFELEKKNIPGTAEKTYQIQTQLIKREALLP